MLISYKRSQGSIILRVKIRNSSVSTGAGLTGLTSGSSGLIISTIADNEATATVYTVAGSTIETITTLGTFAAPTATKCRFKEVDATNHKGVYEIQIADARYAVSSAKSLMVSVSGATNAAECDVLIPLTDTDPYGSYWANLNTIFNADYATIYDATNKRFRADAVMISGDATAADNAEAFFDGTGYAGTNNVIPTVTTLTNLPAITANWLTAAGLASDAVAEIQAGLATSASIAALNNLSAAQVNAEVDTALADIHLDHFIAIADPGGVVANSSFLAKLVSKAATPAFTSYDNTTDSHEALRDRGDAAWITATGFSTLDAAGVRSAVGLASANLDTQLDALPTNAELVLGLAAADDAVLAAIAALNNLSSAGAQSAAAAALAAYGAATSTNVSTTETNIRGADSDTLKTLSDQADTITAKTNLIPASPAAVGSAMTLTSAYDIYTADIQCTIDTTNTQDEYTVRFFKNVVRQTSGISAVTIQVIKRSDGSDLIPVASMTQIGSTGSYKYDATLTERLTGGEAAECIISWTQDSVVHTFSRLVGRDST